LTNKKGWKEKQRERQKKQQSFDEARRKRIKAKAKKSPRKLSKKVLIAALLIIVVIGAVLIWQLSIKPFITIYIRSDGTIDPSSAALTNLGDNEYKFTADLFASIVVERDNIVIDGTNHVLHGNLDTNSTGIELNKRSNVTVTNLKVDGFLYGVFLNSSTNIVLSSNYFTSEYGVGLDSSLYNTVNENDFRNCAGAILLALSSNNTILKNNLDNDDVGLNIDYGSSNNTISENAITNSRIGIVLDQISNNNSIIENSIRDSEGAISLTYSSSNQIANNNLINNTYSIFLTLNAKSNNIQNNNIRNSQTALRLGYISDNNNIFKNFIESATEAITLENSTGNRITENTITDCEGSVGLTYSSSNQITNNNITDNRYGISITLESELNIISENHIVNSSLAIGITDSSNNQITGNTISENDYGVYLNSTLGNRFYANDFLNNTAQVFTVDSVNNVWVNENLNMGNFWSDYETKYPEAEEVDQSGIWNTPYVIDENNADNYPQINPKN
jgi:parallel beta-helix repeat protein